MFGSAFGAESQAVSLRSAVENGEALRTIAAYIDLNCLRSTQAMRSAASSSGGRLEAAAVAAKHSVRAGLCGDPKDYRWCGYAEALGGSKRARRGLCRVMGRALDCSLSDRAMRSAASSSGGRWEAAAVAAKHSWEEWAARALATGAEWYRGWLFEEGREQRDEDGRLQRRGLDRNTVEKVKEGGGELSRPQLLRCRVRHLTSLRSVQAASGLLLWSPLLSERCAMAFTDGVAIGSKAFIENVFRERRDHFGPKRKEGARPIKEVDTGLCSMRALRVQVAE